MILPQNTSYFTFDDNTKNGIYHMNPLETHIHEFLVPKDGFIKIGIAIITMNCEDETLKGYFSDKPMGQQLFYGNSMVNLFSIKKNFSYDELYSGSNGSVFTIYDSTYKFDDSPVIKANRYNGTNTICAEQNEPDPLCLSKTPMKKILEVSSRLILDSGPTYYVMLKNLQNKEKEYRYMTSILDNPEDQMDNECINNYKVSDKSNMYPHFRYPSNNRPGW